VIGEASPIVLNSLADKLIDDGQVNKGVYSALKMFGPHIRPIIPKLLSLLREEDRRSPVRTAIIFTLECAEAVEALPVLQQLLRDPDEAVQWQAKQAIETIEKSDRMRDEMARGGISFGSALAKRGSVG
jgi:HEAT repeat protein